jgi:hypothetical protein
VNGQRPAQPGECCTCGRQALVVYLTERSGEVGWCCLSDGGRGGACPLGGEQAGHSQEPCLSYTLRPGPAPGPEAA